MNQALSGFSSDQIYIERDSPNIEINSVHTVTEWSTEQSRKMRYLIFIGSKFLKYFYEGIAKVSQNQYAQVYFIKWLSILLK